jgi:1,4-alpha-glucan branching enzyme
VAVYRRKGKKKKEEMLVIFNMTPVERYDWKVYTRGKTSWNQIFCSDDIQYWGTGKFSDQEISVTPVDKKNKMYEIKLNLPALSAIVLQ